MPFPNLDAAWDDFVTYTKLREEREFDAEAERYLRMIFSCGATAAMSIITHEMRDDTLTLTRLIDILSKVNERVLADMHAATKHDPDAALLLLKIKGVH